MRSIPKIVEIERLGENKKGLWRAKLITEISIFIETRKLYEELVRQTFIPWERMPLSRRSADSLINALVNKGFTEDQALTKLNYILVAFNSLDSHHYMNFRTKDPQIFDIWVKSKEHFDFEVRTRIYLDKEDNDGVLVCYVFNKDDTDTSEHSTPWNWINQRNLKDIII